MVDRALLNADRRRDHRVEVPAKPWVMNNSAAASRISSSGVSPGRRRWTRRADGTQSAHSLQHAIRRPDAAGRMPPPLAYRLRDSAFHRSRSILPTNG